jgi:hypothetical protein
VPAAQAAACVAALKRAGYGEAAVIGFVRPRGDGVESIEIMAGAGLDDMLGKTAVRAEAGRGEHAHEPVL